MERYAQNSSLWKLSNSLRQQSLLFSLKQNNSSKSLNNLCNNVIHNQSKSLHKQQSNLLQIHSHNARLIDTFVLIAEYLHCTGVYDKLRAEILQLEAEETRYEDSREMAVRKDDYITRPLHLNPFGSVFEVFLLDLSYSPDQVVCTR